MEKKYSCDHSLMHMAHIVVNTYVTKTGEQIIDEFDDYRCLKCKCDVRMKAKPTVRQSFHPSGDETQRNKLRE